MYESTQPHTYWTIYYYTVRREKYTCQKLHVWAHACARVLVLPLFQMLSSVQTLAEAFQDCRGASASPLTTDPVQALTLERHKATILQIWDF